MRLQRTNHLLPDADMLKVVERPVAVAAEASAEQRPGRGHAMTVAEGPQDFFTPGSQAAGSINHNGNAPQGIIFGIPIQAAVRLAQKIPDTRGGHVVEVGARLRARRKEGLEHEAALSATLREARLLVSALIALEANICPTVRVDIKGIVRVIGRIQGGAIPGLQAD